VGFVLALTEVGNFGEEYFVFPSDKFIEKKDKFLIGTTFVVNNGKR